MGEAQVKEFMLATNRPWSVQLVVDNMQKHGIKKTAVTRHLDALGESHEPRRAAACRAASARAHARPRALARAVVVLASTRPLADSRSARAPQSRRTCWWYAGDGSGGRDGVLPADACFPSRVLSL